MTREEIIVTVLTYNGALDLEISDLGEVDEHILAISRRYRELRGTHDFATAARIAKTEWLRGFLEGGESTRNRPT